MSKENNVSNPTQKQIDRINEVDNATYEYLKILTGNADLEWDQACITELNNAMAHMLQHKGSKIYYPVCKKYADGTEYWIDFYDPKIADQSVLLVLRDQDGLDVTLHSIHIRTSLTMDKLIPAIKAASQDFLNTVEGEQIWEYNCHNFNYGDFEMYVSNTFCIPHGFYRLDDAPEILEDDFNILLASPENHNEDDILSTNSEDNDDMVFDMTISCLKKVPHLANISVRVTADTIDSIMETAMLECTYWCCYADYESGPISKGGVMKFVPMEDEPEELTLDKFRDGLYKWMQSVNDIDHFIQDDKLDAGEIDGEIADTILQFALFGEARYS